MLKSTKKSNFSGNLRLGKTFFSSGRNLALLAKQPLPRNDQADKPKLRKQLGGIFGQLAIMHIAMEERIYHHKEGILDLGRQNSRNLRRVLYTRFGYQP